MPFFNVDGGVFTSIFDTLVGQPVAEGIFQVSR